MRIFKSHPLLKLVNSYLIDSSQPSNLSFLWNFGSLLAFCLIIQIITGVTLAMHYNSNVLEAFDSVEHIMRDVNNGWLIRYLHSNTASAFFFTVYFHIGRGLYYGSYKAPRTLVWTIGTVIFILMMATAFLGYNVSPKWFLLNLYNYSYILFSKDMYTYMSYLSSFLFSIAFTLFYFDNFKLSSIYSVKYFQIFSFVSIILLIITTTCDFMNTTVIAHINDDNDINLHRHVNIDKEAAKELSQGLSVIGNNLGLGATIAGVSGAVAKGLVKSAMPPMQKAGIIVDAGLIGGLSHSKLTIINRNSILINEKENIHNNYSSNLSNSNSSINKLADDSISDSPLIDLLFNIEITNYVCLSLIIILLIQIAFKFLLKDSVELHLSDILGKNTNNKVEYYINKIIILNKKMSVIYNIIIIITFIIALSFNAYACNELYNNIDNYITVHNNIKNK